MAVHGKVQAVTSRHTHAALWCNAGAADGSVKVWDKRDLSTALHSFRPHNKPIMRVEWAPYKKGKLPTNLHYPGALYLCPAARASLPPTQAQLPFWAYNTC